MVPFGRVEPKNQELRVRVLPSLELFTLISSYYYGDARYRACSGTLASLSEVVLLGMWLYAYLDFQYTIPVYPGIAQGTRILISV